MSTLWGICGLTFSSITCEYQCAILEPQATIETIRDSCGIGATSSELCPQKTAGRRYFPCCNDRAHHIFRCTGDFTSQELHRLWETLLHSLFSQYRTPESIDGQAMEPCAAKLLQFSASTMGNGCNASAIE